MRSRSVRAILVVSVFVCVCAAAACGSNRKFNESCFPECGSGLVCHGRPARCGLAPGSCLGDGDCATGKKCWVPSNETVGRCTVSSDWK